MNQPGFVFWVVLHNEHYRQTLSEKPVQSAYYDLLCSQQDVQSTADRGYFVQEKPALLLGAVHMYTGDSPQPDSCAFYFMSV